MPRARSRRRSPRRYTQPGSALTPRPRIDEVLARPELQDLLQAAKYHYVLAMGIDHFSEPVRHQAAAMPASLAIWRMVDAVRAEPANAPLPERAIYNYIVDRMFADLTSPVATEEERRQVYLPVYMPRGRPPTRRTGARQAVIDEIRARPDMPDYLVKDRAVRLGAWPSDVSNDPVAVQRRIKRLREDAAK